MENQKIEIMLYAKPLSVNKAWKGRRFKTSAYKAYEKEILALLSKKPPLSGRLAIQYDFFLINMRTDIDNLIKPLQDILQKKGYFKNDNQIITISACKKTANKNAIRIKINEL